MLLNFNGNNQVSSNTYDALGNVINDGTHTYTYDAENRPITVSGGTSYAYDAFGRRVYRQITAGVREYTFDLQGNVLTRIISGSIGPANISIAGRHWGDIPTSSGSTLFMHTDMHTDWLGSARAYTKLDGSVQATCQTLPFGDARSCTVNSDDDYYAGPLWWNGDDSSYLSETRRYNPAQAHWTTTDPAGLAATDPTDPQTWNRYAYVMNNPLSLTDPSGLWVPGWLKRLFGPGVSTDPLDTGYTIKVTVTGRYSNIAAFVYASTRLMSAYNKGMNAPLGGFMGRVSASDVISIGSLATAWASGLSAAATVVAGATSAAENEASSGFTFRGDARSPDVIFNEGFSPNGTSTDLLSHALDSSNPPSAFVATSKSFDVASGFGDNVYVVRPVNGIDVNSALGPLSPFPEEQEIAIPGGIAPSDIRGVTSPDWGVSILNPNYQP